MLRGTARGIERHPRIRADTRVCRSLTVAFSLESLLLRVGGLLAPALEHCGLWLRMTLLTPPCNAAGAGRGVSRSAARSGLPVEGELWSCGLNKDGAGEVNACCRR